MWLCYFFLVELFQWIWNLPSPELFVTKYCDENTCRGFDDMELVWPTAFQLLTTSNSSLNKFRQECSVVWWWRRIVVGIHGTLNLFTVVAKILGGDPSWLDAKTLLASTSSATVKRDREGNILSTKGCSFVAAKQASDSSETKIERPFAAFIRTCL